MKSGSLGIFIRVTFRSLHDFCSVFSVFVLSFFKISLSKSKSACHNGESTTKSQQRYSTDVVRPLADKGGFKP